MKHWGSAHHIVFQRDNSRPHKAKSMSRYLHDNGVEMMSCSLQSPDHNPIENAWAYLNRGILHNCPYSRSVTEIFHLMKKELEAILDAYFLKLVRSMPTRVV